MVSHNRLIAIQQTPRKAAAPVSRRSTKRAAPRLHGVATQSAADRGEMAGALKGLIVGLPISVGLWVFGTAALVHMI